MMETLSALARALFPAPAPFVPSAAAAKDYRALLQWLQHPLLPDRSVQAFITLIQPQRLATVLACLPEACRERCYRNMSDEAAYYLRNAVAKTQRERGRSEGPDEALAQAAELVLALASPA